MPTYHVDVDVDVSNIFVLSFLGGRFTHKIDFQRKKYNIFGMYDL